MKTETIKDFPVQDGLSGWFTKQAVNFERTRFGWMAMMLTLQTCVASIACMYIFKNDASDLMLAPCVIITMACNAVLIAQGPAKLCLGLFYSSLVINVALILMNI